MSPIYAVFTLTHWNFMSDGDVVSKTRPQSSVYRWEWDVDSSTVLIREGSDGAQVYLHHSDVTAVTGAYLAALASAIVDVEEGA